ncbi:MAG: leucyl/phenylalanyl-tRNA--protein transferase [Thiohalophilus sp.]|uniref:leucyl/phenylalanyl-tRNA--protein transferase n=1 Tax=Thiohalophilus sp. TaxID=3028392 RepID=UPI0028703BC8|nr:leucyl/phenylalanyl-tRNA--protein transferase [Thiohalophilus sp.]MDR9437109.1 leucyl/phenylalanyl-tRNA--protein transferase [Thiohalophilus sp.]
MSAPYWLSPRYPDWFPDVEEALRDPDGLLALGGDLSTSRLLAAYRHGIFPWYSDEQPILWWSPDPRSVLFPDALKISRSLRKNLKKGQFRITFDTAFAEVMQQCALPRRDGLGTWITDEMQRAYRHFHEAGHAHSVEAWYDDELVGGLYGVALGKVFFGESMFTHMSDASKIAFVTLVAHLRAWQFQLVDCQVETEHLNSLGAQNIPRREFTRYLDTYCEPLNAGHWSVDPGRIRQLQATGRIDTDQSFDSP